jgi:hypothetical protein
MPEAARKEKEPVPPKDMETIFDTVMACKS